MATEQSNEFIWDTHSTCCGGTFKIRHMKSGRTGARKTWSAAPELLRYLTLNDGLENLAKKRLVPGSILDMVALEPETELTLPSKKCNILELGGGAGYVSVGLAKAFHSSNLSNNNTKIMCSDMDRNTIKNLRHNICENKETKTVAVEKLEWSNEVGGDKFDKALERNFRVTTDDSISKYNSDPVTLLTHVIASDVHYGETTLHPLSSIIASIKYRNPHVQVIMMLNERSALKDSIAELVEQIELKVLQKHEDGYVFNIHVRDVIQSSPTIGGESKLQMKLIEC